MSALNDLGTAIERALDECPVSDVLSVLTGSFVGLTIELVRRQGCETDKDITIDGGMERNITIHAPKSAAIAKEQGR